MKKKSIFAGILLLVSLTFAPSALAMHEVDPGGGGSPPVKCSKYPCPERP